MDSKYVDIGTPPVETARFDYSRINDAGTVKTQGRIELAAEYLWNLGYGNHGTSQAPILFADLTKKQKLQIVADHLERVIIDAGKTFKNTKAQKEAATAADEVYDHVD